MAHYGRMDDAMLSRTRRPSSIDEALPDATVRRFLLRAGFLTSSARATSETRQFLAEFVKKLADAMLTLTIHDRRSGLRLHDVLRACAHFGIRLYGYDDLVVLPSPDKTGHDEVFHVTELVECRTKFSRAMTQSDESDVELGALGTRTDFVANYATWERDDADDLSDPELDEWSCYSDSEMESESSDEASDECKRAPARQRGRASGDRSALRSWQQRGKSDGDKFVDALQSAQAVVDAELSPCDEPESEEVDSNSPLGQGYYSDCEDSQESSAHARQATREDQLWDLSDDVHVVDADAPAPSNTFQDDVNQYVITRGDFRAFFQSVLHQSLRMGAVSITSVALSALHNASEQYLHRALSEECSLRYRIQTILMEQEFIRSTSHLESKLEIEREQVNAHARTISDLKASFRAKEREMQQQIAQLQNQLRTQRLRGNQDVEMKSPTPTKRKKTPAKRKVSRKHVEVVGNEDLKASRTSKSLVGALRPRIQELSQSKKPRINPV